MEADNKQITNNSEKKQEISSFFDKDAGFVFVYKKTEKLASAVYMVTGLFSDSEPMKWTLRKKISDLVSFIINHKESKSSEHLNFVHNSKVKILEFVSLLEISHKGNLISEMNFSILKQEFLNLVNALENSNIMSGEKEISKSFFDVSDPQNLQNRGAFSGQISHPKTPALKDKNLPIAKDEFKRTNRQTIIINLLKKRKDLTIKDISEVIKDCSEKTIQRELIYLMNAGAVKRTGERRWSKYSLV